MAHCKIRIKGLIPGRIVKAEVNFDTLNSCCGAVVLSYPRAYTGTGWDEDKNFAASVQMRIVAKALMNEALKNMGKKTIIMTDRLEYGHQALRDNRLRAYTMMKACRFVMNGPHINSVHNSLVCTGVRGWDYTKLYKLPAGITVERV